MLLPPLVRNATSLRTRYQKSGTDAAYLAMSAVPGADRERIALLVQYNMHGTDTAYCSTNAMPRASVLRERMGLPGRQLDECFVCGGSCFMPG